MELNKKHLSPSDTPNSINYKISDFIGNIIIFNDISLLKKQDQLSQIEFVTIVYSKFCVVLRIFYVELVVSYVW